jgi:hypothetical protein
MERISMNFKFSLAHVLVSCACLILASMSEASVNDICDRAARKAAKNSGVPVNVLLAITRTETGRADDGQLAPWPWTVNMEGVGKWFDNRQDALRYVQQHFQRGARSFDLGCFQINYKWHGDKFRSINEMFDPNENAAYAARFLKDLFDESGDWTEAAGAYHSRTETLSQNYARRFSRIRESLPREFNGTESGPLIELRSGRRMDYPSHKGSSNLAMSTSSTQAASLVAPMLSVDQSRWHLGAE